MAQNLRKARYKRFSQLWQETRITLLRSCTFTQAQALISKLKSRAKASFSQLGILELTVPATLFSDIVVRIVDLAAGIAFFFSDGSALFAPRNL